MTPRERATLAVTTTAAGAWSVRLDRPEAGNALTPELVDELRRVLAEAGDAGAAVLALRGSDEVFCTGMDLAAAGSAGAAGIGDGAPFWALLSAIRAAPLLVVAVVEGRAAGGGVGLVAAADVVIAGPGSTFALPEALWGLLPCCVAPFLAERIGRRQAELMALTTTPVGAEEALRLGLVDQVAADPGHALRVLTLRQARIDPAVRARAKRFFGALPDRADRARDAALAELAAVTATELVTRNLRRFAADGSYPWEA